MALIIVAKRWPGEKYDVREFVRPDSVMVQELAGRLAANRDFVRACYEWVKNNIQYPPALPAVGDWHRMDAFPARGLFGRAMPLVSRESYDFWQFPQETLATRMGDCEDMAILLCSLLRTRLPESSVFVTVGDYSRYGHAWVVVDGVVYDPAPANGHIPPSREGHPYSPRFRFNDRIAFDERR